MSFSAVKCPEAGADAIITFSFADLEKLDEEFGDDYVAILLGDLDRLKVATIRKALAIGLKAGDAEALCSRVPVAVVAQRLADGLWLTLHGRRLTDQAEGGEKVQADQ